jgi:hypothetical protein
MRTDSITCICRMETAFATKNSIVELGLSSSIESVVPMQCAMIGLLFCTTVVQGKKPERNPLLLVASIRPGETR